jgi:membrane protease YdiL (CAAX protease family)
VGFSLAFASLLLLSLGSTVGPGPQSSLGHERAVAKVNRAYAEAKAEQLASYERHMATFPEDYEKAIERCRFIQATTPEDGVEPEATASEGPDVQSCAADLSARFGSEPEVVLFQLSLLWGEEAKRYALAKLEDAGIAWTPRQRAQALSVLAQLEFNQGDLEAAVAIAQQAAKWDPTFDRSLFAASYYQSIGQAKQAVAALSPRIDHDRDAARLIRKAGLLLELDAPALALRAIQAALRLDPETPIDPLLHGRALEANNLPDAARALYGKHRGAWNSSEILTRLFYLDLQGKDATRARASYDALMGVGWDADALGRHRLALLLHHPGASWALTDLLSVLGFFLVLALCGLFPALIILPIHYIGLLRRARGADEGVGPWTLRHAWLAMSILAVSSFLGVYLCAYAVLEGSFYDNASQSYSKESLAHSGVLTFTLMAILTAALARRADWQRLARPATWLDREKLKLAGKAILIVVVAAWLNNAIATASPGLASSFLGAALSIRTILSSIQSVYGIGALLLLAVVIVPLYEEYLFRGVILSGFARQLPFWGANCLQAALFALIHDDAARLPYLTTLGLLTGFLQRRTGGLATGILLHATANLLAVSAITLRS